MKIPLPYFTKKQRLSVLVLLGIIIVLQAMIYATRYLQPANRAELIIDPDLQKEIDSLKQKALKKYEPRLFNPNFINYERGFRLGMSPEEVDRLLEFRTQDKYVNSAAEFQKITGISDSLLHSMSPYFKFPEWTQLSNRVESREKPVLKKVDLNKATYNDLVALKGIGDYFANAVLNEREKLGGFVSVEQLRYIKGLRPEAVTLLKQSTFIKNKPAIVKVNINTASREELIQIPYITSYIAREIVVLRSKEDQPLRKEDLEKISSLPLDKLKIIELYLDF